LNIDQRRPYLKTIEADGNQDQLKGINDGVASDLFQPGETFGEQGVLIRDHDGVLVSWHAEIVENLGQWTVEFHSENCSPTIDIDLDNFGSTLLKGESLFLKTEGTDTNVDCWGTLSGTDGRTIEFTNTSGTGMLHEGTFSSQGTIDSTATYAGQIQCQDDVFDIKTTVTTLGSIPNPEAMYLVDTISVDESTTLTIPYQGQGRGSGAFTLHIEGPLSRVAEAASILQIDEGNGSIILQIEPRGLLQENMFVLGTIHLEAINGEYWEIDVELQAKSEHSNPLIGNQALVFSIFFFLFSGWFATSIVSRKPAKVTDAELSVQSVEEFLPGDQR